MVTWTCLVLVVHLRLSVTNLLYCIRMPLDAGYRNSYIEPVLC